MVITARYDMREPTTRSVGFDAAARGCRRGRLIVLPVDAAYGVGTDAFSVRGVAKILAAKGRGRGAPLPVLVGREQALDGLLLGGPSTNGSINSAARALASAFWPGPLTIVGTPQPSLTWDLGAADRGAPVALRMPLHPVALAVLREVGPMAVTAVTDAQGQPVRSADEAMTSVGPHVSVFLDAGVLPEMTGSTVVDVTGGTPVLLRHGALSMSVLLEVCPDLVDGAAVDSASP
jgi:L-threonylcarbamoyladenylate synthase